MYVQSYSNCLFFCAEHTLQIIGQTAKPKWLRQLCWLVVQNIGDVARPAYLRASSFGESYLVDIGLIFNDDVNIKEAAKISQNLKKKLEGREDIAVAMVCLVDSDNIPVATPQEAMIALTPEETITDNGIVNLAL